MIEKKINYSLLDLALILGTLGLILVLFFPTLRTIALICWTDDDYSHGLLLPLVAAYMIWDRRADIARRLNNAQQLADSNDLTSRESKKERSWFGALLLLIAGLIMFFVGRASGISFTSWLAFFPTVFAAIYLLFGRTAAFTLAPPLLLLLMAKPLPDSVVVRLFWPLQVFAAEISASTLKFFDVPVYVAGNIIEIPQMKLLVEEACSGMRSVMALLTLAVIVLYFIELKWISKLLLIALSLLVALVLNVFRVAITGLLAHFYDPETATGFFHTFSGLIVFLIGLPVLYGGGLLLMKLDRKLFKHQTGN